MPADTTPADALGTTVADRSLRIATALSAEVIVLRERLAIIERLAAERGVFSGADIDGYQLSPEAAAEAKTKRLSFLERVFGALRA
ncbi:hypothetical protein [Novosphingobium sp. Leaf2]|uniref:hypothetical protein n=1 Tax=Novosphingobium sp. Leaf2 TaxID=1735670 RepID=UPI0006F84623|nr:hypothetical protein [Novosphingobium sp. Leaf2]KQM22220.1 hypothetical protein ASE49_02695 [Novosphingobium sp. Leaf2]